MQEEHERPLAHPQASHADRQDLGDEHRREEDPRVLPQIRHLLGEERPDVGDRDDGTEDECKSVGRGSRCDEFRGELDRIDELPLRGAGMPAVERT